MSINLNNDEFIESLIKDSIKEREKFLTDEKHKEEIKNTVNDLLNKDLYFHLQHDRPELQIKIRKYLIKAAEQEIVGIETGNPTILYNFIKRKYDNLF